MASSARSRHALGLRRLALLFRAVTTRGPRILISKEGSSPASAGGMNAIVTVRPPALLARARARILLDVLKRHKSGTDAKIIAMGARQPRHAHQPADSKEEPFDVNPEPADQEQTGSDHADPDCGRGHFPADQGSAGNRTNLSSADRDLSCGCGAWVAQSPQPMIQVLLATSLAILGEMGPTPTTFRPRMHGPDSVAERGDASDGSGAGVLRVLRNRSRVAQRTSGTQHPR